MNLAWFWVACILAGCCLVSGQEDLRRKPGYKGWRTSSIHRRWLRNKLGNPVLRSDQEVPPDQWFDQTLDHFHPTDDRTWRQRYFVNDTFYRPGGPAFLMIGGEGQDNPIWMVAGTWLEYAKQYGAICFSLEHRFYGQSHPTEDMSVKNLVYLTSTQALADLANFISTMNEQHNLTHSKWIAFGGSYPGSLAAWLRLKYPHLVHGSVSTSGPLIAKADFHEYLEVVSQAIDLTSPQCNKALKRALQQAEQLTLHRVGWNLLSKLFRLCSPFDGTDTRDTSNLLESLVGNFEDVIQYNKDNREFEGVTTANITINDLCNIMDSQGGNLSPIQLLAKVNSFMLDATKDKCLEHTYQSMIKEMQATSWSSSAGVGGRQWTYQTCTEFGWYQTSNLDQHPYTDQFNLTFFEQQCSDIFGAKYNQDLLQRGIQRSNVMYGGKSIKVSNVVFVHGSFDPWHALGITQDVGPDATAIFIQGTAHCANMYPEDPEDPPQLKAARQAVGQKIGQWLKQ